MSPIVTLLAAGAAGDVPLVEQPVGTVAYWLSRLSAALDEREERILTYEEYYRGAHPLQFASSKYRETFGSLFSEFADNWCPLVVDACVERLKVIGFRFGAEGGEAADRDAWNLWQANYLDADSGLAHLEAVKTGESYLIVEPGEPPRITVEHPLEVIIAVEPGNRRRRLAALKRWVDELGYQHATVYLPEAAYRFRTDRAVIDVELRPFGLRPRVAPEGTIRYVADDPERVPNPFNGIVPVIPMRNAPQMIGGGTSDLEVVIDVQNAINKLCTDMMVAAEYAAFRQRWATGVEIPIDPTTGVQDVGKWLSAVSRMWVVEDENARFGDFNVTDLTVYVRAIEMFIQHLAARTRTPPHYLLGQSGAFPSGESLKATETGLVAKVRRKQVDFGEAWEEAMRLAFYATGDVARARAIDAEVLWADPESRSEGERVDALVKLAGIGVPEEALWARIPDVTPQTIERWRNMAADQARRAGVASGGGGGRGEELELSQMVQRLYLGVGKVLTVDEARAILDDAGAGLGPAPSDLHESLPPIPAAAPPPTS